MKQPVFTLHITSTGRTHFINHISALVLSLAVLLIFSSNALSQGVDPPSFIQCPSDFTQSTDPGVCDAVVTYTPVVNGLPPPLLQYDFTGVTLGSGAGSGSGSTFNLGTTTVTLTADNGCPQTATCVFNITIEDQEAPSLSCQDYLRDNLPGQCHYIVNGNEFDPITSDNCGIVTLSNNITGLSSLAGHAFGVGSHQVIWTTTDATGNFNSCTIDILISDIEAPSILCPPHMMRMTLPGVCHYTAQGVEFDPLTVTDNCPVLPFNNFAPGQTLDGVNLPEGLTTITWTVVDPSGTSASCSFDIDVVDMEHPVAVCQDITVLLDPTGLAVISPADIDGGSSDNCSYQPTSVSQTLFSCFDILLPLQHHVWINEFHYDNIGTDVGEFIEIAGKAGTDLAGYSLVLYNGANNLIYSTMVLNGIIPDEGQGFGALAFNYPTDGIQNGPMDGIAFADPSDVLIEFLSYEGTLQGSGGPADGVFSTDVGVQEDASTPIGYSLQRTGLGRAPFQFSWAGPSPESPGMINNGQIILDFNQVLVDLTIADPNGLTDICQARVTIHHDLMGAPQDIDICVDDISLIDGVPSGGGGVYQFHTWSILDDGGTGATNGIHLLNSSQQTVTFDATGLLPGVVTLSYQVVDFNGCYAFAECIVTVLPVVVPTLSIVSTPSGQVCATTSVTFDATWTGGGSSPFLEWRINTIPVGPNGPSFTHDAWTHGDQVDVVMTSSDPCAMPAVLIASPIVIDVPSSHLWQGNVSSNWHDISNWNKPCLPELMDDVTIQPSSHDPVIQPMTTGLARGVTIASGAILTVLGVLEVVD